MRELKIQGGEDLKPGCLAPEATLFGGSWDKLPRGNWTRAAPGAWLSSGGRTSTPDPFLGAGLQAGLAEVWGGAA